MADWNFCSCCGCILAIGSTAQKWVGYYYNKSGRNYCFLCVSGAMNIRARPRKLILNQIKKKGQGITWILKPIVKPKVWQNNLYLQHINRIKFIATQMQNDK